MRKTRTTRGLCSHSQRAQVSKEGLGLKTKRAVKRLKAQKNFGPEEEALGGTNSMLSPPLPQLRVEANFMLLSHSKKHKND